METSISLVRPFSLLRKGKNSHEKLNHHMPFGNPTLPLLGTIVEEYRNELSGKERLAMKDANGIHFMLTFDEIPYGPTGPAKYQVWKLASKKQNKKNKQNKTN